MPKYWHVHLFGSLRISRGGEVIHRFQGKKTGGLLAILAYNIGQPQPRDLIIERLWPRSGLDRGRQSLSTALTSLRHQMEPPDIPPGTVIQATRLDVVLRPHGASTDLQDYEESVYQASIEKDPASRIVLLERAATLARQGLLAGYYDDWILAERERLNGVTAGALRELVRLLESAGQVERAIPYAMQAVSLNPDSEEALAEVVRLNRLAGREVDAGLYYRKLTRRIRIVYGRDPSPEVKQLARGLPRAGRKRLLRERQAGLAQQARVAAPRRLLAPAQSLPAPVTRFFGREAEIASLLERLAPGAPEAEAQRLVTLVGPGGSGKTRLALEAARRLAEPYQEQVLFVDLGGPGGRDPAGAILQALQVPQTVTRSTLESVAVELAGRPFLLVLDNVEHVHWPAGQAAASLLTRLPELRILATSREPLHIVGENLLHVEPLPVPEQPGTPLRLLEFACVQMFVDRAQASMPDFQITSRNAEHIADLCRRLEGVPLAIELAAARASALTPAQMTTELARRFDFLVSRHRNRGERHRSLAAAIEWSWMLLPAPARRTFASLAAFRGGWTLEAAREVCGQPDVLEHLEILVDRSLAHARQDNGAMRYRMLESIREFADARLRGVHRDAVCERHAAFYLRLAERCESLQRGPRAAEAVGALEADHENLRAALRRLMGREEGLRMAAALWRFWMTRGYAVEGRKALGEALEAYPNAPIGLRARALHGLGALEAHLGVRTAADNLERALVYAREAHEPETIAHVLCSLGILLDSRGDSRGAMEKHKECLALRRAMGDTWGTAGTLNNLGRCAQNLGDLKAAQEYYQQSQALYKELGDRQQASVVLNNLGAAAYELGDFQATRAASEQTLELARQSGNVHAMAVAHHNIGEALLRLGRVDQARTHTEESIRLRLAEGDRAGVTPPLATLASILAAEGEPEKAARLLGATAALRNLFEIPLPRHGQKVFDEDAARLSRDLGVERFQEEWALGSALAFEQAVALALRTPEAPLAPIRELAARI